MTVPEGFETVSNNSIKSSGGSNLTRSLFSLILENSLGWAKEGWGGYITANSAIYLTPMLGKRAAVKSMQPLADWAQRLKSAVHEEQKEGIVLIQGEYGSWMRFFRVFADGNAAVGKCVILVAFFINGFANYQNLAEPISLSSRLIPNSVLETSSSRAELLDALLAAQQISPGLRLIKTTPFNYRPDPSNLPSVHPAWRSSVFHVTNSASWNWNTSLQDVVERYRTVRRAMEGVRKVAGKAAYVNEADVYEDEWEGTLDPAARVIVKVNLLFIETFYGPNYQRLLEIKNK